jgi:hypothetical protein
MWRRGVYGLRGLLQPPESPRGARERSYTLPQTDVDSRDDRLYPSLARVWVVRCVLSTFDFGKGLAEWNGWLLVIAGKGNSRLR